VSQIIYRTALAPDWIDYNGHLRDAYYGLIVSYACDALIDRLGMDSAYRERTRNTLYTVEMHIHFLRELNERDTVAVSVRLLGWDQRRIHAAFDILRDKAAGNGSPVDNNAEGFAHPTKLAPLGEHARDQAAASAELMLLHVHQGEIPTTAAFPPDISSAIAALAALTAGAPGVGPGSRRIELRSR
jgi:acyl-CoA thioesterase FadM